MSLAGWRPAAPAGGRTSLAPAAAPLPTSPRRNAPSLRVPPRAREPAQPAASPTRVPAPAVAAASRGFSSGESVSDNDDDDAWGAVTPPPQPPRAPRTAPVGAVAAGAAPPPPRAEASADAMSIGRPPLATEPTPPPPSRPPALFGKPAVVGAEPARDETASGSAKPSDLTPTHGPKQDEALEDAQRVGPEAQSCHTAVERGANQDGAAQVSGPSGDGPPDAFLSLMGIADSGGGGGGAAATWASEGAGAPAAMEVAEPPVATGVQPASRPPSAAQRGESAATEPPLPDVSEEGPGSAVSVQDAPTYLGSPNVLADKADHIGRGILPDAEPGSDERAGSAGTDVVGSDLVGASERDVGGDGAASAPPPPPPPPRATTAQAAAPSAAERAVVEQLTRQLQAQALESQQLASLLEAAHAARAAADARADAATSGAGQVEALRDELAAERAAARAAGDAAAEVRGRLRDAQQRAALKADQLLSCEARLTAVEGEAAAAAAALREREAEVAGLRVRALPCTQTAPAS